jgi:hypothetical protein
MFMSNPSSTFQRPSVGTALRAVAMMTMLSAGFAVAIAQAPTATERTTQAVAAQPALNLQAPALDSSSSQLFSSSSDAAADTTTEASLNPVAGANFANMMQYGGGQRRRYGTPRYRGSNTNQDGSPKYTFMAGVGLVQPIGNTYKYLTPSYGFQVGAGRNFNAKLGLLAQFDYDHFGFTGQTLSNQTYIYNNPNLNGGQSGTVSGLDGTSHVWSFTLDPVFNVIQGKSSGLYAVAGVGFYHKTANFTVPGTGVYCDPYYGCYQYSANQTIDKYTSNAPGFNGGLGATYKFSRFSNERFYIEARYVVMLNSQRTGITYQNASTTTSNTNDYYPANSNRTTYIPIKVGLRF